MMYFSKIIFPARAHIKSQACAPLMAKDCVSCNTHMVMISGLLLLWVVHVHPVLQTDFEYWSVPSYGLQKDQSQCVKLPCHVINLFTAAYPHSGSLSAYTHTPYLYFYHLNQTTLLTCWFLQREKNQGREHIKQTRNTHIQYLYLIKQVNKNWNVYSWCRPTVYDKL